MLCGSIGVALTCSSRRWIETRRIEGHLYTSVRCCRHKSMRQWWEWCTAVASWLDDEQQDQSVSIEVDLRSRWTVVRVERLDDVGVSRQKRRRLRSTSETGRKIVRTGRSEENEHQHCECLCSLQLRGEHGSLPDYSRRWHNEGECIDSMDSDS